MNSPRIDAGGMYVDPQSPYDPLLARYDRLLLIQSGLYDDPNASLGFPVIRAVDATAPLGLVVATIKSLSETELTRFIPTIPRYSLFEQGRIYTALGDAVQARACLMAAFLEALEEMNDELLGRIIKNLALIESLYLHNDGDIIPEKVGISGDIEGDVKDGDVKKCQTDWFTELNGWLVKLTEADSYENVEDDSMTSIGSNADEKSKARAAILFKSAAKLWKDPIAATHYIQGKIESMLPMGVGLEDFEEGDLSEIEKDEFNQAIDEFLKILLPFIKRGNPSAFMMLKKVLKLIIAVQGTQPRVSVERLYLAAKYCLKSAGTPLEWVEDEAYTSNAAYLTHMAPAAK